MYHRALPNEVVVQHDDAVFAFIASLPSPSLAANSASTSALPIVESTGPCFGALVGYSREHQSQARVASLVAHSRYLLGLLITSSFYRQVNGTAPAMLRAQRDAFVLSTVQIEWGRLNQILSRSKSGFLVGECLTAADVATMSTLFVYDSELPIGHLTPFKSLCTFFARMGQLVPAEFDHGLPPRLAMA